jgi:hypothetical protein
MKNTMSFLSQKKKNILKRLLRNTVCAVILSAAIFSGSEAYAQLTQSVQTKEAREVTATSAIIELELSDKGFQSHGFAIKSLSEFLDANPNSVLTGLSTKDQIGECITVPPNPSNPYTPQSRVRSLQKNNLTDGEAYYYYSCATTTDGNPVSGEIKFFTPQGECSVQNVSFTEITTGDYEVNDTPVELTITTQNCDTTGLRIILKGIEDTENRHIRGRIDRGFPSVIFPRGNEIKLSLQVDRGLCFDKNDEPGGSGYANVDWGYECINYIEIITGINQLLFSGNSPKLTPQNITSRSNKELRETGIIVANCSTSEIDVCPEGDFFENDRHNWDFEGLIVGRVPSASDCNISDGDVRWIGLSPAQPLSTQLPSLSINTTGCIDIPLTITIYENDLIGNFGDSDIDIDLGANNNSETDTFTIVPIENNTILNFKSTNQACDILSTPDCKIYVHILYDNKEFSSAKYIDRYTNTGNNNYISNFATFPEKGIILADGTSFGGIITNTGNWTLLNTELLGVPPEQNNPQSIQTAEPEFDKDSPCLVNSQKPSLGYKDDCYEFLAPIPGFGVEQKDSAGVGTGRVTVDLSTLSLGDYLNQIFQIALGILMVLAVIMIVVGGVQYMTSEAIFQKTEAKDTITKAVTGLILGLGIFVILNTINPRLLEIDFGEGIDIARINTVVDPAAVDGNGSSTSVSNVPATNICNNRKDRGYWLGQNSYKLTQIAETANNLTLGSLEATGVNFKTNVNSPKGTSIKKQAEEGFSQRVRTMIASLNGQNITTRITEAFGPSFLGHGSPCHYLGSCIDLATGTDAASATYSVDDVEKIIRTADQSGLTAQFEFSNAQSLSAYQDMQKELGNRGIDRCMVKYVTGATNWHFSIYDKTSPELTLSDS